MRATLNPKPPQNPPKRSPRIKGDIPSFSQRGEVPAFLNGLYAFHDGIILAPLYAPYQQGQPIPFGALWTVTLTNGGDTQALTPIPYYLAGAAGVPIAAQNKW